jgi:cytochrome c-type biogenesis protein CcmH/NrfG
MVSEPNPALSAGQTLQPAQVYTMAAVCLLMGLAIGYLLLGSQTAGSAAGPANIAARQPVPAAAMGTAAAANGAPQPPPGHAMHGGHMPTLEEMRAMADKQAAPLLEKLKTDPNNSTLLMQVGAIYHGTHQFNEAAVYYGKAVNADPKNVALRTKLASSLYRSGDVDGALAQLKQGLHQDPTDANSLFDLGMIRLQGKQDSKGAVAAWQQLLKTNPQLSQERRDAVEKLMASVLTTEGDQHKAQGASHDERK